MTENVVSMTENAKETENDDEVIDWDAKIKDEEEKAFSSSRARAMASPDAMYMLIGSIGAKLRS